MLLPVHEDLSIPVRVICPTVEGGPLLFDATIVRFDGSVVTLRSGEEGLSVGLRVVLDGGATTGVRVRGEVVAIDGDKVTIRPKGRWGTDQREFPRAMGVIRVWYRLAQESELPAIEAWVGGGTDPADASAWHPAPPIVDFSASGLRFQAREGFGQGALLALRLQLPDEDAPRRVASRVVRSEPLQADQLGAALLERGDRRPTHSVAVQLADADAELINALAEYSLRVRESSID